MPNSLWPHGLQPARLPCPSPSPGVCSDPCPLSQWCQPTISSSSTLFSSCSQSYPALRSFPMSQLFTSGGQSIGASASASVLPMDQSVSQFSHSVVPDSLWPHGLQHARPPCPSPTQTHVHWVSDAIQTSHPLSSPSPPAFNLSQHQALYKWVSSSHQVAKVLELQLQHESFQSIFRVNFH